MEVHFYFLFFLTRRLVDKKIEAYLHHADDNLIISL